MPSPSRWLNWKPKDAPTPQLTTAETDKTSDPRSSVSFVGLSVALHAPLIGSAAQQPAPTWEPAPEAPLQDHAFWAEDFGRWALAECLFLDRCFGGVKALHSRFSDWCLEQNTVGCMPETFEALLTAEGFLLAGGLVSGLLLREDFREHEPAYQRRVHDMLAALEARSREAGR